MLGCCRVQRLRDAPITGLGEQGYPHKLATLSSLEIVGQSPVSVKNNRPISALDLR